MEQRSPVIINLKDASSEIMRFDRGHTLRLINPGSGASNIDVHMNVLNVTSGPGPYHYHEHAENVYIVVEGTLQVTVEGKRYILKKEDVGFIPAGLRHRAGNAGDVPAKIFEIYAPAGPDFHIVEDPAEVVDVSR